MTKEQYNEWRNHPATMFYRQFLKEYRASLIEGATEAYLNGNDRDPDRHVMRGRILALFDVEDLNFDVIENFYKEKEANGAETNQDGTR